MSNDAAQVERFALFMNLIWAAPLQVAAAITLIVFQVGIATVVGVAFLVLLAPVNALVFMKVRQPSTFAAIQCAACTVLTVAARAAQIGKLRRLVLKFSDERVKMMSELLNGVRIIKFCASQVLTVARLQYSTVALSLPVTDSD